MKLIIAIVQDNDARLLMDDLVENNFSVTKLSTTGGFLREGNTTLLLGVEAPRVQDCLDLISSNCKKRNTTTSIVNAGDQGPIFQSFPINIEVGGATVFVLDVEQFIRL